MVPNLVRGFYSYQGLYLFKFFLKNKISDIPKSIIKDYAKKKKLQALIDPSDISTEEGRSNGERLLEEVNFKPSVKQRREVG